MGAPGVLGWRFMSTPRAFVPRPRRRGVVAQEVDGETLLYVEETHQASCLNGPAARIWALVDGERTVEAIAAGAKMELAVVGQALRELGEAGLVENVDGLVAGVNLARRRMLVGVGLAAIPIVLMVTAPEARAASSQCTPRLSICSPQEPPCCPGSTCQPGPTGTCL
jgi:hypothetical protein